ncbi:MAG: beta-galactosidase [Candidatus Ornithomonoglobus sp.]
MNIFEMDRLCYGGDYNPEQWINYPGIWDEDIRLMKLAKINCVTLGVFSWSSIEKQEGVFDFSWLDTIIDKLYKNGVYIILATPSGARPPWLAQKYPEVLRVREDRIRHLFGKRHNHCLTSPVYREKTAIIDEKLSERYGRHPAVILWHISNEFSGECHCPRCQEKFREWLKNKYHNNINELNHAWWSTFWSHTYTDWSQIESPSSIGEGIVHAHNIDWKRFASDMTIDFYRNEVKAVKKYSCLPVTANFMDFEDLDYYKFSKYTDIVSWDNYQRWHNNKQSLIDTAMYTSFLHDMFRCMKQKPFLMIESTPSLVNWHEVNKLKATGLNTLASIQAVAHGSEGVMYFQIRKSRGASEKFHGAVIDHNGNENTRVFSEVMRIGNILAENPNIKGSYTKSDAAVLYEFENTWAVNDLYGLKKERGYRDTCIEHYSAMRKYGVNVDVIGKEADFSHYKVICAPMLYMMSKETADKIRSYVADGGIYIATYLTAYVNETDLCYLGGFPGNLKDVFGIWNEEIDSLYDENAVIANGEEYRVKDFCERIHPDNDTEVLGTYKSDFYAGEPAITRHNYGNGTSYYIAARTEPDYLKKLYSNIFSDNNIMPIIEDFDDEISVAKRGDSIFIMNFSNMQKRAKYNGEEIKLKPYECIIK